MKTRHPLYSVYRNILNRCFNRRAVRYAQYGGRGITVCDRWLVFENFVVDMGPRPSSVHTLDRADNDGDYEPGNCRWATQVEQQRNRSNNRRVEVNGENLTVSEWASRLGLCDEAILHRLDRGWDPVEAVTRTRTNRYSERKNK